MKIYVAHASGYDFHRQLYQPLKASQLWALHEMILPHEASFRNSREIIRNCDLLIAEVSFPSTGLGIELAWAHESQIKILCLAKKGHKISSSIQVISQNVILYHDSQSMIQIIIDEIHKLV